MPWVKLLLSVTLIFTIALAREFTTFNTDEDKGQCGLALPTERLPVNVEPVSYDIKLYLRPHYNEFSGECGILIHAHRETSIIRLHTYKIKTSLLRIELTAMNRTLLPIKPVEYRYCKISQILDLHFNETLFTEYYYLKFFFNAPFGTKEHKGVIQHVYKIQGETQRWFFMNQQVMARRVFPCWDEPEIRATFKISIVHPKKYTVLSNMQITSKMSEFRDLTCTYFNVTPLIAPSEVAFVMFDDTIHKFDIHEFDELNHKRVLWQRPRMKEILKFAHLTMDVIKKSLALILLVDTIISKTDYVVIPNIPINATRSPGLIIFREQDITYYENIDFFGRKLKIVKLLARQEALQWFGGPVIPSAWFNLWIGESFATYFSHYFPMEPYYNSHLMELFVVQILQPALHNDIALQMKPIEHETYNADAIDVELLFRLYSCKGSVILRMMENFLTTEMFRRYVIEYVRRSILRFDKSNVFWDIMQGAYEENKKLPRNLTDIMDGWIRQRHYPELSVVNAENIISVTAICESGTEWHIPINIFTYSNFGLSNISNITWLQCPGIEIISEFSDINFIIVNWKQFGYYRVNYEHRNWRKIVSYLLYDNYRAIPVQNRAQLIDDAYYFVMAGKITPSILFNLIHYLKRETHYVPWHPMFNILSYTSSYLDIPEGKSFKSIILESLDGLLRNIEYQENSDDDDMTKSLRLLAANWACKLGHVQCQKIATTRLKAKLLNSMEILPWWKDWVYCMGVKQLDMKIWRDELAKICLTENVDTFKYLVCTDNDALLIDFMNVLVSNVSLKYKIGNEKLAGYFRSILKRNLRKDVILNYVLQNFETIANRLYGNGNLVDLWSNIILNLQRHQIEKINSFSNDISKELSPGRRVIELLIKLRNRELNEILNKMHPS